MNATSPTPQVKLTEENAVEFKKEAESSGRSLTVEVNRYLAGKVKGNSHQRRTAKRKAGEK